MIGRVISHYKILKKVGEGGMGVIYLAEDTKLGRKVAMKILTQKLTEKNGARERFKREAKTAASVNHPNIVTVHEIDEHEDLIYIVMEYVEGETLDKKIKIKGEDGGEKATPLEILKTGDIINIVLEVCKGLEIAHKAGIVHRDIKLENILINREGRVKILDFGLAKLKGATKLTRDSAAVGTAFYMSPEQLKGEDFDHRIDIWSLGVTMYVMTTGELPFVGDSAMEIIYSIMKTEPQPIVKLNKKVPPGLRRIISRCLRKNPEKRYPDIAALVNDLNLLKDSLATGKSNFKWKITSVVDRLRGKFRRIIIPAAAAILTIAALLLIPSTSIPIRKSLGLNILPREKRVVILPLKIEGAAAPDSVAFSKGLVEHLTRKLTRLEQFDNNLFFIPTRKLKKIKKIDMDSARKNFGVNLIIDGSISCKADTIDLTLNLVDTKNKVKLYTRQFKKHKSDLTGFRDNVMKTIIRVMKIGSNTEIPTVINMGCTSSPGAFEKYLHAWGNLQNSTESKDIDPAIHLFKRAIQIDTDYALAYAGLAEAYFRKYKKTKKIEFAENTIKKCRYIKAKNWPLACAYITLGRVYKETKEYDKSELAFQTALKIDPVDAEALYWLARVYQDQKKSGEAEETLIRATHLRPSDYSVHNNLGVFYYNRHRHEKAVKPLRRAVTLAPDYVIGLINLGSIFYFLKRWDEARPLFEHSLSIEPTYEAYSNLGTLYFYQGLYDLSTDMFKKALEIEDSDYKIWGHLGESYYWTPGRDQAKPCYNRAVKLAEAEIMNDPDSTEILSLLAFYYNRLGKRSESEALLKTVLAAEKINADVSLTICSIYELMGEREQALVWIKSALMKGASMAQIEHNPVLGDLRSDPRFQDILNEIDKKNKKEALTINK